MPNLSIERFLNQSNKFSHLTVPIGAVIILLVLLVPLPSFLLDVLISFNLMFSVMVLLVSMYILEPVKFSSFPNLLLLTTLYRLALNVATSRLILTHGNVGESAAGTVIKAFGEFVIGGNYVVGVVIFLILLAIQFLVVNHGAVRSSEVTARFTLDAMPGKQMAVDADLSAGLIDENQARQRRADISQAAEFHGAMDGAIRFTQRDAVASIIIVAVNIFAGFAIGVFQHGLPLADALKNYTTLTVGDGVAAAVPSLFISVAAAIITTRSATKTSMGAEMSGQLLTNPKPLFITAGVLLLSRHFARNAAYRVSGFGRRCRRGRLFIATASANNDVQNAEDERNAEKQLEIAKEPEKIEQLLKVDALALEVGYGLVGLVSADDSFLNRIREIRRQAAIELGIIVPSVHVTDNLQLAPREYAILLKGEKIAGGELHAEGFLAIDPGIVREKIQGIETTDPAFGMPAVWIRRNEDRDRAVSAGYTVVDPTTVVCTHLVRNYQNSRARAARQTGNQSLARRARRNASENRRRSHAESFKSLGETQRVLQNLLRERVPIRDLATILEAITDVGVVTRDVNALTEAARTALARTISSSLSNGSGELTVLTLDPRLETQIAERLGLLGGTSHPTIEPEFGGQLLEKIETACRGAVMSQPVVLCSSMVRPHLRKLTERFLPELVVIAHGEVASNVRLVSMGTVT